MNSQLKDMLVSLINGDEETARELFNECLTEKARILIQSNELEEAVRAVEPSGEQVPAKGTAGAADRRAHAAGVLKQNRLKNRANVDADNKSKAKERRGVDSSYMNKDGEAGTAHSNYRAMRTSE